MLINRNIFVTTHRAPNGVGVYALFLRVLTSFRDHSVVSAQGTPPCTRMAAALNHLQLWGAAWVYFIERDQPVLHSTSLQRQSDHENRRHLISYKY